MQKEQVVSTRLQWLCPTQLVISWHENRRSFLSYLKKSGQIHLRLHRLFLEAPSPVLEALISSILTKNSQARKIVRQMAHLYFSQARATPASLTALGKVHNLQEICDEVKREFFSPDFEVLIGWSETSRCKNFRSITFGSYDRQRNQIRIHSCLDDKEVPLYFLRFLIYHEMLHAVCPSIIDERGRCSSHTREFKRLEKQFPQYREAKKWSRMSLQFFKTRIKVHGRT